MAYQVVAMNGEVTKWIPYDFAEVHRCWIKAENPETIITCKPTNGVWITHEPNLCCRSTNTYTNQTWTFRIRTQGKRLEIVALSLNQNLRNFSLQSVSDMTKVIGVIDCNVWCNMEIKEPTKCSNEYYVKIKFTANQFGTYRQDVLFYFGKYPIILQRLCMDCLPPNDFMRIDNATNYQFSQSLKQLVADSRQLKKFESPFVPPKDPKEEKLSMIYPYPNRNNFFLTQETLTDGHLTQENYRGRLHELITIEELARHEHLARYNVIAHMHLVSHYVLRSTGDASTIAKYAEPGGLFGQLVLSRSISEDTKSGRLFLRSCNTVLFKRISQETTYSTVYEAYIEDKCTNMVYVRLSKNCVKAMNVQEDMDLMVQAQFVLNRLPFCEWHRAVDCLPNVDLVFLSREQIELKESDIIEKLNYNVDVFHKSRKVKLLDVLNVEQRKAIGIMTVPTSIPMPPLLLLGPFGTGKTYTIAEALYALLTKSSDHKVLLCTHSNSAADLYVKEFFDDWSKTCPRLRPVRIYYKGRAKNTVHPAILEYCLMEDNHTFRYPTEEDLHFCSLVVTTLTTASALTHLNLTFTHIVVDEAAQALECEILIPLSMATPQTRVILAGDQMQLAPEIYSNLASERGLGVSLLERIYTMYPETHPCRIHLCQNYRSHKDIIKFTSEMFYDGIVNPGTDLLLQHPAMHPLTFYAVHGEEVQDNQSTGHAHVGEVIELVNRVMTLKENWPVSRWGPYGEDSIGVLACYAEQVQMIRTELRKLKMSEVSVERVLNVQGKQFTAVFISVVRNRNCCRYPAEQNVKDYGFLTNPRLLNTAITRARCLVAVVGDPVALLTIGSCRKLWQRFLEVADLHGIDRKSLEHHISLVPELPRTTPLNPLAKEFVPRTRQDCSIEYVPVIMRYAVVHCPYLWK